MALYGCTVMPSAVHVTGSPLSGVEPLVLFNSSCLYTMPYCRRVDNSVMICSPELLQSSDVLTLFNTIGPAMRTGSDGEERAVQIRAEILSASYRTPTLLRSTHGSLRPTVARRPQPDALRRLGSAGTHPGQATRHGPPDLTKSRTFVIRFVLNL